MNEIVRRIAEAADSESPRAERARESAEILRAARDYRWVAVYDVGDDEIALLAHTGAPPAHPRFSLTEGLSGQAVRTRAAVASGSEIIVPVLGAESGIVIGTLDVESDGVGAFSYDDVSFLEECAAVLRPLYD